MQTPGIKLKHLRRERDGRVYLRLAGKSIRLQMEMGTPAFLSEYLAALQSIQAPSEPVRSTTNAPGSFAWLVRAYLASGEFRALAANTRRNRRYSLERLAAQHGTKPFARLQAVHVRAIRDERANVPNAANAALKDLRALYKWAVEAGHAVHNPAAGVPKVRVQSDGYHTWTGEEVRQYLAHWQPGSTPRLALALLLYTGARRSDVVRLGPQMVQDGVLSFKSVKTGASVSLPILPALKAELDMHPTIAGPWLRNPRGQPYSVPAFGVAFKRWAAEAGVKGTAHGIRKAAATIAAENGATEAQLNAIFGWGEGSPEARRYTRAANKRALAAQGARLISVPLGTAGTEQGEKAS